MVMDHSQEVDYSAFILALFSTPQTEGQSCMPPESLGGMGSPQSHDLRQFGGCTTWKKQMSLGKPCPAWRVAQGSFHPAHTSWTSWISESMRPADMAISWKVQEGSWDLLWFKLGWCILKYTPLVVWLPDDSP